jgi:AraC family transcriptional regulator
MSQNRKRYLEVIDYIENNLERSLDLDLLCSHACLSKYHFHRQFSALFGISIIAFVRMQRLKKSAHEIVYRTDMKIVDIALSCGYESHEAYSRVFKQYFSVSPSDFRKHPNWSDWEIHYEPILQLRYEQMKNSADITVSVEVFPLTNVATIEHKGSPNIVGTTVQAFIAWRKQQGLSPNRSRTFNLLYHDPKLVAPDEYRMDIGCTYGSDTEFKDDRITRKVIPPGLCAKVRVQGGDDKMGYVVQYLYSQWLEQSDYELRDFPVFIERVSFYPNVSEAQMLTDVYLPIQ